MAIGFPISSDQLFTDLAMIVYRAAIFLVILALGWIAGRLTGIVVGKIMSKAGGDSLLRHTVIGRALIRSDYTSYKLGDVIAKWLIYFAAFLIALESLSFPILTVSVALLIAYLPLLVGSIFIFAIGVILSDWMGEFVKKSTTPEKRELFYLNIVGDLVKAILYFVTITLALGHLGVDVTILYIIAQAFAWAIAISVGVAVGLVVGWALKDKVKEWLRW